MSPSLHRLPGSDFLGTMWLDATLFSVCAKVWGRGREGVDSPVGIWERGHRGCLSAVLAKRPRDEAMQRKEAAEKHCSEEVGSELGLEISEKGFSGFGLSPLCVLPSCARVMHVHRCIPVCHVYTYGYVCTCSVASPQKLCPPHTFISLLTPTLSHRTCSLFPGTMDRIVDVPPGPQGRSLTLTCQPALGVHSSCCVCN